MIILNKNNPKKYLKGKVNFNYDIFNLKIIFLLFHFNTSYNNFCLGILLYYNYYRYCQDMQHIINIITSYILYIFYYPLYHCKKSRVSIGSQQVNTTIYISDINRVSIEY